MLLALKNIGKIEKAEVKLDGITVIAGENNTGKSTVGKVLYSVFNSFYKINDKIYNEKLENIERAIDNYIYSSMNIRMYRTINLDVISNEILKNADKYIDKLEMIKQEIIDYRSQLEENLDKNADIGNIDELIIKINSILKLSNEDIIRTILKNKINMEFNGQINNIYLEQEGSIGLTIKDKPVLITINDDNVDYISDKFDLNTEAIYIDDPFVLDEQKSRIILNSRFVNRYVNYMDHREHIKSKIFGNSPNLNIISEILATNKLENIFSKINNICSGEIVRNKTTNFVYKEKGTEKLLDIRNISAGLKTFVIIKTLLQNGSLEENGTMVLDEPEIHLHPEWQLLFAELIVLIQKEFGMHILLNTHSPYFLNAIEVYSVKYEIADRCNYYLASLSPSGQTSTIINVTNDIEKIYKKLAKPLQDLETERYLYE
jgi:predicted ATPase